MPQGVTNGINLYYEEKGQGDPLLLIAGLGYGLWMWHKMVPHLAEHFRVISFDNRGAGRTDKPDGPYSAGLLADDAAGLLDALNIEQATVMGHSMGGFIAQELTLGLLDLVGRLILSATNFGGPNHIPVTPTALAIMLDRSGDPIDVVKRGIAVACAPGFAESRPDLVQELLDYRLTNPVPPPQYQSQMAVGLGLLSAEASFEYRLPRVQVPVLILFGEHDAVVPPGNAELLAGRLLSSHTEILPGAGHMFPIEAPAAAAQAIIRWAGKEN